jgi:hypothetical protein
MKDSEKNWLYSEIPFPRPEYAKQTEALLTDLLWRSAGSKLVSAQEGSFFERLAQLQADAPKSAPDPERLIPQRRSTGSSRLVDTFPLAKAADLGGLIFSPGNLESPVTALLDSVLAPRARGDKADACVPVHPSLVSMQTLHGLVNKESPANLAAAIETMGWLGGAAARGEVAAYLLGTFQDQANPRDGLTGLIESAYPRIAAGVWAGLPGRFGASPADWPIWPDKIAPASPDFAIDSLLSRHERTPFAWFWKKWRTLCTAQNGWHKSLPTRRFVDWTMCLLRSGLAFSYLWEAEFFCRLHDCLVARLRSDAVEPPLQRLRTLLIGGAVLGALEPSTVPASEKGIWPSTSELLARGYEARRQVLDVLGADNDRPKGASFLECIEKWISSLSNVQLEPVAAPLQIHARTANNQKEFVRYLLLPRSSDDDAVDQADFYYLAKTNSRHVWLQPGPEWLVVISSLLGRKPGGQCTLGAVIEDLASLGIRAERSVLVELLEDAGLTTDSPDADNALIIHSGF